MADQVPAEWVVSEDPGMRYDARALIRKFEIVEAIPALQQRASALRRVRAVGAPGEVGGRRSHHWRAHPRLVSPMRS